MGKGATHPGLNVGLASLSVDPPASPRAFLGCGNSCMGDRGGRGGGKGDFDELNTPEGKVGEEGRVRGKVSVVGERGIELCRVLGLILVLGEICSCSSMPPSVSKREETETETSVRRNYKRV